MLASRMNSPGRWVKYVLITNMNCARIVPIWGIIMRGLRPLTSDQGPRKSETMIAGMAVKMLRYMLMDAVIFSTSFSLSLKLVKFEQIAGSYFRFTKQTLSIKRF